MKINYIQELIDFNNSTGLTFGETSLALLKQQIIDSDYVNKIAKFNGFAKHIQLNNENKDIDNFYSSRTKPVFFINNAGRVDTKEPRLHFTLDELKILFNCYLVIRNLEPEQIIDIINKYSEIFDMDGVFVTGNNLLIRHIDLDAPILPSEWEEGEFERLHTLCREMYYSLGYREPETEGYRRIRFQDYVKDDGGECS